MQAEHKQAIEFVRAYAQTRIADAMDVLSTLCDRSNVSKDIVSSIIENISRRAQIVLHFHPDRLDISGQTVACALLEHGRYLNQFESHVSNGLLAPTHDSRRAKWEDMLFESAYVGADLRLRPKYGSLDLLGHPQGPSPRFGSCHFRLKPACSKMATFCYGDSSANPKSRGTMDVFEDVLGALLEDSFVTEQTLGLTNLRPPALFAHLQQDKLAPSDALSESIFTRNLNAYIEAQIHGDLYLSEHVDALVADPSFQNTEVGETLLELCTAHDIELEWHEGYQLHVDDVRDDYRGGEMSAVARKIAENDMIHPELLGRAIRHADTHPDQWVAFDLQPQNLLKYLWHVLIRFGSAFESR